MSKLTFETDRSLSDTQSHKFRGYVADQYREYELAHNHQEDGGCKYHYPLIQYKVIDGYPTIIGIGEEAISISQKMFCHLRALYLRRNRITIKNSHFEILECNLELAKSYIFTNYSPPG